MFELCIRLTTTTCDSIYFMLINYFSPAHLSLPIWLSLCGDGWSGAQTTTHSWISHTHIHTQLLSFPNATAAIFPSTLVFIARASQEERGQATSISSPVKVGLDREEDSSDRQSTEPWILGAKCMSNINYYHFQSTSKPTINWLLLSPCCVTPITEKHCDTHSGRIEDIKTAAAAEISGVMF